MESQSVCRRGLLGLCLVGVLVLLHAAVWGQSQQDEIAAGPPQPDAGNLRMFVELVRSDIKTQKAAIIARNMEFTQAEAVRFWPLYRQYDLDLNRLHDQRFALIRSYVAICDRLTDKQARKLADEVLSLEAKRTALKRTYFNKLARVITAQKALRFFQIENQIDTAIDLGFAASLPLIK